MLLFNTMRTLIPAVLILVVLSRFAHAQWHDAYKNPMSSWGAYMYDQNVKRHLRERTSTGTSAQPTTPTPRRAAISATDFRRDVKRKDVVAQLVNSGNLSQADATTLTTTLRSTMAQLGAAGRKDNVATAMAIVIALSFVVLEKPDFDATKADDLIPVANDALAASPQFKKLSAADKQLMYDTLLLSAAVIAIIHQSGDKETSQAIAKNVLQQLVGTTD